MMVRDAAVADIVPKMTELEGYGDGGSRAPDLQPRPRGVRVHRGEVRQGRHPAVPVLAAQERHRRRRGRLRRSAADEAGRVRSGLRPLPEGPLQAVPRQGAAGRLRPRPGAEPGEDALRAGAVDRAVALGRSDRGRHRQPQGQRARHRPDLVEGRLDRAQPDAAASTRTSASTTSCSWASIRQPMPWMSWSPKGDRLAYFVRTEKERTLIVQNVLTREDRGAHPDEVGGRARVAGLLARRPDGRVLGAARRHRRHLHRSTSTPRRSSTSPTTTSPTTAPTYSPDGKFIVYTARVSGNQKLFRLDLATKKKTQITFGTQDETAAQFIDDHTIVFSSTATDPAVPLEPEVAKNGNIYNIWTLDLTTGELRQYTDARRRQLVADRAERRRRRAASRSSATTRATTASTRSSGRSRCTPPPRADFGAPGPIIDFQAPLQHTLVKENQRKKGTFEKMFLEGRPPVNVGVTNNGDVFGGTQISFGDVLGDKQVNLFAASISQYRTLSLSYVNLSRRFQFALQGYSQTQFFYGQLGGVFYDPAFAPFISRDDAIATRTVRGGSAFGIYPFNRYRRMELSGGLIQLNEEYNDPGLQAYADAVPAGAVRHDGVPQRHAGAARRRVRPGDDGLPRVRTAGRQHDAPGLRRRAEDRQPAVAPDLRRRRPPLPAARRHRRAGDAHPRLQEHRRLPRLPVLRRQLRAARLRLPRVRRPERRLRQRRAALPDDRGGADADRRHRRHPRRVLRRHRRRVVQQPAVEQPVRGCSGQVQVLQQRHLRLPGSRPGTSSMRSATWCRSSTRRPAWRRPS